MDLSNNFFKQEGKSMALKNSKDIKANSTGFQVDKNVIYYGNTAINCNNISLISILPVPANKSWIYALLIGLGGLLAIRSGGWGWFAILVAAIWIIAVAYMNNNRGENLAIILNSGNTFYFNCTNRDFLNEVIMLMVECINSGNGEYSIRFDKCAIVPGASGNISIR